MDSQFSAEGNKQRERMQKRLKEAKSELDSQRGIWNDNPSYLFNRATKSVKYYSEQIIESDVILQRRIEKSHQETDDYKESLRRKTEEADHNLQKRIEKLQAECNMHKKSLEASLEESMGDLEIEKVKKPARLVSVENRYSRILEEYIKLGFETTREKSLRLDSEKSPIVVLQSSDGRQPLGPHTQPPLEILKPLVCCDQLSSSPPNFVNGQIPNSLNEPINQKDLDYQEAKRIFFSDSICDTKRKNITTISESSEHLLQSKKLIVNTSVIHNSTPTNPLTQVMRFSSTGKPMKSVKVALKR